MNQETLGEKAGLHHTYIGQVERGEKNLTVGSLVRISDALGISPEQPCPIRRRTHLPRGKRKWMQQPMDQNRIRQQGWKNRSPGLSHR